MKAIPARCLRCQRDLRYDLANMRYYCPACDAGEAAGAPGDVWRVRGQAVGRGIARLWRRVEQWLGR
jgi:Zn finger protein HypA/HybF involved in hydrogenase expression